MAIFRTQKLGRAPALIIEAPGKVYIEGQAHNATTPQRWHQFSMTCGLHIMDHLSLVIFQPPPILICQ